MLYDEFELEAKIEAVNKACSYANDIRGELIDFFVGLKGKKIKKLNGSFLEKYKKLLPKFVNRSDLSVYAESSDVLLSWSVKSSVNVKGKEYCIYHCVTIIVGYMKDGVLVELREDGVNFKSNWSINEVKHKLWVYNDLKRKLELAKYDLVPFDE
jgi:hypothetical protein